MTHKTHTKKSSGVAIYVREGISCTQIQINNIEENTDSTILIQGVTIYGKKGNIDILNVYISPGAHTQYENIKNIIHQLSNKTLIVGDFNAHNELWDPGWVHKCHKGDQLVEFLEHTHFTLLNDGRITYDCSSRYNPTKLGTTPDITMGSPELATNTTWDPLPTTLGSDHYPIKIVISTQFHKTNAETMSKWKFYQANWDQFSNMCHIQLDPNIPPDPSLPDDVNSLNEQFTSKLQHISNECIPKTSGKLHNRPTNPWWTQECTEAIKHRAACQRRWRTVSNPITKEKYKQEYADAKLNTKQVIENAKNEGWKNVHIQNKTIHLTSKDVWDKFK